MNEITDLEILEYDIYAHESNIDLIEKEMALLLEEGVYTSKYNFLEVKLNAEEMRLECANQHLENHTIKGRKLWVKLWAKYHLI